MANQLMTSSGELTAIIPEIWSQNYYSTLMENLPFIDSVARDYENEIQDLGDTVNVSQVPQFDEASELAEGAQNDADGLTVQNIQLVINKRVVKDFIVTKKALLQSIPFVDKLEEHAAFSIMKKMHSIIVDTIVPSAAAPDHDISYDSGTTLALADMLEAKELLDLQNVPDSERKANLGVPQANDLFLVNGFTSRDFIPAGSPLTEGAINTPLLGFEIRSSSLLGNNSFFFHPQFMHIAVQESLNMAAYDLGSDGERSTRVNTDVLFGVKQFDGKRIVKIS